MPFGFDYGFAGDEMSTAMLISYVISMLISLAISAAFYVMQSASLYTIANRRSIKKPWLAWVPFGNVWIMGCISDQYRYVAKGQVKSKRKALLVLNILTSVLLVAFLVIFVVLIFVAFDLDPNGYVSDEQAFELVGIVMGMLLTYLAALGLAIAAMVIQYMALYDLFMSCDPSNGVMYLLLSILIGLIPVWLLICRKKDLGMPPRKQNPATYAPQQPAYPQPTWHPVQAQPQQPAVPAEPWDVPEAEPELMPEEPQEEIPEEPAEEISEE